MTRIGGGYGGGSAAYNQAYSSTYARGGVGYSRGSSYSTPSYHTPFVAHSTGSTVAPSTAPMQGYGSGYTGPAASHSSFGGGGGFSHGGSGGGGGHAGGGGGHGGHR